MAAKDPWGWDRRESDEAFAAVGDRVIESIRELRRVQPRLQRPLYTVGGRELTAAQIQALEVLAGRPSWRMHEVADKLGVDQSTATRTLSPLVDLGLVRREPDASDRRYVTITVTAAGRRRSSAIVDRRRALMRDVLGQMAPDRRVLFADLLDEYVRAHAVVLAQPPAAEKSVE